MFLIISINPARPQLVITLKLLKDLLCGILDLGFWILGFGIFDVGILVSHVTVTGAWRDKGNSVTCNGFWGLEGQGK